MNEVTILIPFKNSSPERLKNLFYVIKYYNRFLPTAKIVIIEQNTITDFSKIKDLIYSHLKSILTEDLFCRGFLFNEGFNHVPSKYYILADADMLIEKYLLENFDILYPILEDTYIIPYEIVYSLYEESTKTFIEGNNTNNGGTFMDFDHWEFKMVGGIGLISGRNFYNHNGFGLEYVGWGGEDDNFFNKILVSGIIKIERLPYTLIHLWHLDQKYHGCSEKQLVEKRNNIPKLKLSNHDFK